METFALIGVITLAAILAAWGIGWFISMISNPIGRAVIAAWIVLLIGVWGVGGLIWLAAH